MKKKLIGLLGASWIFAGSAYAGIIPYGIQSDISLDTVTSWGWSEIHRSSGTQYVDIDNILNAVTGEYLMMGVWNPYDGVFGILGAGATDIVSGITYDDYNSDNGGTTLDNWSNGINFYRTAGAGSWGFTSNTVTELNSADIMLLNGLQSQNGQTESSLSRGLSFHTDGLQLTAGWAYNTTGNDFTSISNTFERVFFEYTPNTTPVPEPSTMLLLGTGLAGLVGIRRRKK